MKKFRPPLNAALALVGAGALTLGGVALPAMAEEPAVEPAADLGSNSSAFVVDKYAVAAAQLDTSVEEVKQLEAEGKVLVSVTGKTAVVDPAAAFATAPAAASARVAPAGAAVPGDPVRGSLPGANVTIYLDFDGENVSGTAWNVEQGDPNGTLAFAPAKSANQAEIWAAVAEDYAPYSVNVTTTDPGEDAILKTSADDQVYGVHVVITDSYTDVLDAAFESGGIAYPDTTGSKFYGPALVFPTGTSGVGDPAQASSKSIAEAASHEAGHKFSLEHDGFGDQTYYSATGGIWGPIMGASYVPPLTQWSNGDYANSTSKQDDMFEIGNRAAASTISLLYRADNGMPFVPSGGELWCEVNGSDLDNPQPGDQFQLANAEGYCDGTGLLLNFVVEYTDRADFRADTVGNTTDAATALDISKGKATTSNVILTRDDVDVYSFTTAGGDVTAAVDVAEIGPNLDSKLFLYDSSGTLVAQSNQATSVSGDVAVGLNATILAAGMEAGTYYLEVDGEGQGDNQLVTSEEANGYSDYGSVGNYTLTVEAPPVIVDPVVITAPANGDEVALGTITVTGTAEPGASVTVTGVGGAVFGPVTADEAGNWSLDMPTDYGNNPLTATQSVDGAALGQSETVVVTVPVPAPAITAPADGADITSVTFWGTGIPGAVVNVSYGVDGGAIVTVTETVDADGNWTVAPSTPLAPGEYSVVATQTLNDLESPFSNTAAFTIVSDGTGGTGGGGAGAGGTADGSGNGNLPNTGSDVSFASLGFGALALLLVGGGLAVAATRKRQVSNES